MNLHIVPVFVAVSTPVAASCGGSDGSESSPDAGTAGADTTVRTEDNVVATTAHPASPDIEVTAPAPAPAEPAFFVGWSNDRTHWGWQFTTEEFGANGGAQFAVGGGAVVAMYLPFEAAGAGRIFTAQVG